MKPIHMETEIAAPPSVVWSYLRDPEKFDAWMIHLEHYERTNDVIGVGETFKMGIKEGGRTTVYEGEILEYDEGRSCTSRMVGGCGREPMSMVQEFELEERDGSTIYRQSFRTETELKGFVKLIAPLGAFFAKLMMRKMAKNLSRACTGPTAQPA